MESNRILTRDAVKLAEQHHQAGRWAEAEALCRQVLAAETNNSLALNLLGIIAYQTNHAEAGIGLIKQAIAIDPSQAAYPCNLGVILASQNKHDEAISFYHEALRINPNFAYAFHNLGNSFLARNEFEPAAAAYQRAISLRPAAAESFNNLGNALLQLRKFDESIANFRQAVSLRPNLIEAVFNLGNAFQANDNVEDAIQQFKNALEIDPNYVPALINLGFAYQNSGEINQSLTCYEKAHAVEPANMMAVTNRLFALHLSPDFDAKAILREHRLWNDQFVRPLMNQIQPLEVDRSPNRKLKIGYLSADFRSHPVGRFLLPLLTNHDHENFEIFCYANVNPVDKFTDKLQKHADVWRNVRPLNDDEIADQIRKDRIDILVDLGMHTDGNRILVFARKPAPVQATYLAYCSTSGMETMDYRLSDPHLDPPDSEEDCYIEKTVRLAKTYWCYEPHVETPELNPPPVLQTGFITFGCLNNFSKNSVDTWETWLRVLKAVPDSRLILFALTGSHRQRAQDRLADAGLDPARLLFVGKSSGEIYFQHYLGIDIGLDPFPYCGGTTTCDALWMGVPVVTLRGRTAVGRAGVSIMNNVGLPELVANNPDEYVEIAAKLARDLPRLTQLRSSLRRRMKDSPLTNAPQFARDVESAYRQIWQDWCETHP